MATQTLSPFKSLIEDLEGKYPFRELSAILRQHELGTAPGWRRLETHLDELGADQRNRALAVLTELRDGLIVGGTKAAFVFDLIETRIAQDLAAELAAVQVPAGHFADSYPRSLAPAALSALDQDHRLARKIVYPNGDVTFVLCARRTEEERVTYDLNEVTQAVRDAFSGYDEFVAVRRVDYQVFDIFTVRNHLKRIEVLIDHPDKLRSQETPELRCLAVLGRISTLSQVVAEVYEANSPLNLMLCVSNLYHSQHEGRVARLSFRTPTGSVNRGAMTSTEDLRSEAFHEAGVAEVGDITPYALTLYWDTPTGGVPGPVGVDLTMPINALSSDDFTLRDARVISARSDAAVVFAINKLVAYSS